MALTHTHKITNTSTDNVSSYVTASITPTANTLLLAYFASTSAGTSPTVTCSGNGLTWVEVRTRLGTVDTRRITCFRAMGASPSAEAVTFTTSAGCTSGAWSIQEWGGVDTSGTDGSGAVVQSVDNAQATGGTLVVTLGTLGAAGNGTSGGFFWQAVGVHSAGSGFTLSAASVSHSSPNGAISSEYKIPHASDTTVDASSTATGVVSLGIAVEVKEAAAATKAPVFRRRDNFMQLRR